jgi:hypothetical protein
MFAEQEAEHLPSSVRSLLQTKRSLNKRYVNPGYYVHFGVDMLAERMDIDFQKLHEQRSGEIQFDVNWDGAESVKSSASCIWPIQLKIRNFHMTQKKIGK